MGSLRAALLVLFLCGITTHFSTGMIIYKDVISGDEMFSDTFRMRLRDPGILYEVEGKLVTRKSGFYDDTVTSGVDIVLNHNLQQTNFDIKQYTDYMKGYVKRIKEHLQRENPGRVDKFMTDVQSVFKEILAGFKEWHFFRGESKNKEGMVALLYFRDDDTDDTPYMLFFKDGLEEEKG